MKVSCRGLVVFVLLGGVLAGCDSGPSSPGNKPQSQKITVLASVYPMAEIVKRIGGEYVDAQWLTESGGQRPEEIEASLQVRARANRAALVVTGGPWDGWTGAELSADARTQRLVEPERTTAARGVDAKAYLWLDPILMREIVETVRVRLTLIDPAHEDAYRQNAQACRAEVDAVHNELDAALDPLVGRKLLAVRPVWGALCGRYRIVPVTPVDATEEKLTAGDFKELARVAKVYGFKSLFVDVATAAAVRQRIEEKTGLRVVTLDALGTSAPDGRSSWSRVMRYDAAQLKKGLE